MNVLQGKRDSTAQDGSVQGDAVQNGIVQNGIAQNGESHIIFAEDLAPSDTAQLDRAKVLGPRDRRRLSELAPRFWRARWACPPSQVSATPLTRLMMVTLP